MINNTARCVFTGLLLLAVAVSAVALPDFSNKQMAGSLIVYPDDKLKGVFYYQPGDLILATDQEGKPELNLLQIRYTGTAARDDRMVTMFRSLLTFRIVMNGPTPDEVRAAKEALASGGRRIELRPLPVRRLEAALVYALIQSTEEEKETGVLPGGHFESAEGGGETDRHAYWNERVYTLSLDVNNAQVFWDTLEKGQVALSLGYAFFADGIAPDQELVSLSGSPELVDALHQQLKEKQSSEENEEEEMPDAVLVKAGATSVTVDASKWPDLLHRVDLNESVPPGYAVLDVYCYDFNNNIRTDLYKKEVEIEAEGVGGRAVRLHTEFHSKQPDLYARSIHFPFAVRLDRPYRYRIVEIAKDGNISTGPWIARESWTQLLDVTTPIEIKDEGDTNTMALNDVTLSLRTPEGCAAISPIVARLLRHFIPRNGNLLNAFALDILTLENEK